jgi:hypothetical protein
MSIEATIYNTNRSRHLRMIEREEIAMDRNELLAPGQYFPSHPVAAVIFKSDIEIYRGRDRS